MAARKEWRFAEVAEFTVLADAGISVDQKFVMPLCYEHGVFPKADAAYPNVIRYRSAKLHRLQNVKLLPNHVIVDRQSDTLLPQTFMRNRMNHHGGVKHLGADIYRSKYDVSRLKTIELDCPVYYAETDHPLVYGHVLLEVVSSLWALSFVQNKDFKVATSTPLSPNYIAIFEALGIDRTSLIRIDSQIVAPEVYFPDRIVQRRQFFDPKARAVYSRLGAVLEKKSESQGFERIYISRSKVSGRRLLDEDKIECLFSELGFKIVHPQELSLADQIKIFSTADFIAGSGGSAMHNTIFSKKTSKVLILSSVGWVVVADSLICQNAGQLAYTFGRPELMPDDTHRTQADWSINVDQVRMAVRNHFGF